MKHTMQLIYYLLAAVQANNILLAADDVRTLTNAKYGNFEFHSWQRQGDQLIVGARNELLIYQENKELNVLEEKRSIQLRPDNQTISNCRRSGNAIDQCDNVLLAIGKSALPDQQLWVCGTHAARPILFKFNLTPTSAQANLPIERTNGQMCPSNTNSAAFIIPIKSSKRQKQPIESFFTVTGDVHQASIIKSNATTMATLLRTPEGQDYPGGAWLSNPQFVSTMDRGDRLLIFFREMVNGKWVNRVASLCKGDVGGSSDSIYEHVFMSYVKMELTCSQKKETEFIFDKLISVFESENSFFGVFATSNTKGEYESAVCQFLFDELDFKFVSLNFEDEHGKKTKNWESYRNEVNEPYSHPYLCSDDANNYPLWLQNWRTRCPALSGRLSSSPLFTPLTGLATSITVNYKPNVEIFIGLATGDVIKFELDTDNQLKRVSTKPSDSHNIDCGGVKALSMHNDNLLIAWERCLIEQQGWPFSEEPLTRGERDTEKVINLRIQDAIDKMAVSVQRALDRKSDEHKEEMSEMENKVHDMQKVINIMSSKVEWMETMLKDFDLMRDSFEISKEMRDESNRQYQQLRKEINKNRIRVDVTDKRVSNVEEKVVQLTPPTFEDTEKTVQKRHPEVLPLNKTIDRRVNVIENEINKINRTVHDKTTELEKMAQQHQDDVKATYQRVISHTNQLARAKQQTCYRWIEDVRTKVDLLENHYKVEAEKKSRRRKRKARSGKKKKVVEISGEQMPEKQVPPLRSLSFSQRH